MKAIYLVRPADGALLLEWLRETPGIGYQMPEDGVDLRGELAVAPEGEAWALVDDEPVLLADHRGTVYSTVTCEAQQYDALGDLPEGLTSEPRPSLLHGWIDGAWQLDPVRVAKQHKEEQEQAWELIKSERDRRKEAGLKVGNKWVHSDLFSRSQWLGLKDSARDALAAGCAMVDGLLDSEGKAIVWKMLDGSFVPVTAQLAFDVVAAVTRSDMAIFTVAEQHRAAMVACQTPAEYDCTANWPQTYADWAAAQGVV
jgi:hypothetical protein